MNQIRKRKCKLCGSEFIPKHPVQKFCSKECSNIYFNLTQDQRNIVREVILTNKSVQLSELLHHFDIRAVSGILRYLKSREITFRVDIR